MIRSHSNYYTQIASFIGIFLFDTISDNVNCSRSKFGEKPLLFCIFSFLTFIFSEKIFNTDGTFFFVLQITEDTILGNLILIVSTSDKARDFAIDFSLEVYPCP